MPRYIDADALLEKVQFRMPTNNDTDKIIKRCVEIIRNLIENAPTADVAPVVRGWWERVDSSYYRWTPSGGTFVDRATYRCSRCGRGTAVKSNYCPNCGAKMDGEEFDE